MYQNLATHILIKTNEISLKRGNRHEFEQRLYKNIRAHLEHADQLVQKNGRTLISLFGCTPEQIDRIMKRLKTVSGISGFAPCSMISIDNPDAILENAFSWMQLALSQSPAAKTFAIRAKRVNKDFPMPSKDLETEICKRIHATHKHLKIDLKKAELRLNIEIRKNVAILYTKEFSGMKGLPLNNKERVVCLLSGGIDSPVAAYEMLRKGITPVLVHFHSHPYTSENSILKVMKLAACLAAHSSTSLELWLVPFLEVQKQIRDTCNERYLTVHYRRYMLQIAEEIAKRTNAKALVTGDSLGQVASQTLTNLSLIEAGTTMPVFRPLLCKDKETIINQSIELGSYEISLEPHDDACTLFASKHPVTEAKHYVIADDEEKLPHFKLIYQALDQAERRRIYPEAHRSFTSSLAYETNYVAISTAAFPGSLAL